MTVRDTSRAAYKYIETTGGTTSQYVRIVGLLKRFKNGMTIAELHAKTGLQKSSISTSSTKELSMTANKKRTIKGASNQNLMINKKLHSLALELGVPLSALFKALAN